MRTIAPTRRLLVPLLLAASVAPAAFGAPQGPAKDPIGAARDLYASARYDEALAVLNDLKPEETSTPPADRKSIEQYRSLCLLALGRGSEAETAIAAVITTDPTYLPTETDASPRVRAAFSDVRRKLLPDIASSRYTDAKATFDKKDFAAAAPMFRRVIALLDDPDMSGRMTDLRTLAAGFLDLSVAATPPPEPPKPQPVAPPVPAKPTADPRRIYTTEDHAVTPPAPIRQAMPPLPQALEQQAHDHGVVELVIDEQGRVSSVAMRQSVHPIYDNLVVTAARDWHYQPATFDGVPVKFRKLIQINVTKHED